MQINKSVYNHDDSLQFKYTMITNIRDYLEDKSDNNHNNNNKIYKLMRKIYSISTDILIKNNDYETFTNILSYQYLDCFEYQLVCCDKEEQTNEKLYIYNKNITESDQEILDKVKEYNKQVLKYSFQIDKKTLKRYYYKFFYEDCYNHIRIVDDNDLEIFQTIIQLLDDRNSIISDNLYDKIYNPEVEYQICHQQLENFDHSELLHLHKLIRYIKVLFCGHDDLDLI